jgi:hypothetical protein
MTHLALLRNVARAWTHLHAAVGYIATIDHILNIAGFIDYLSTLYHFHFPLPHQMNFRLKSLKQLLCYRTSQPNDYCSFVVFWRSWVHILVRIPGIRTDFSWLFSASSGKSLSDHDRFLLYPFRFIIR